MHVYPTNERHINMDISKKILVVEDNLADVELIKLVLKNLDARTEILHFFNGQELLDHLQGAPLHEVGVILLDLNMPKLGGIDVLKAFQQKEEYKKLPVVVFTSSAHQSDVSSCYSLGANAYVTKPIDINEFDEVIKTIACFWMDFNIPAAANEK